MPYDFTDEFEENSNRVYYYSHSTGQGVWERPTYAYEDHAAAALLQARYRSRLGWKAFRARLNQVSLDTYITDTISTTIKMGWTSWDVEGMSLPMYLLRAGYILQVKKATKDVFWKTASIAQFITAGEKLWNSWGSHFSDFACKCLRRRA